MKKTRAKVTSQIIVIDANVLRGASSTDRGPPSGSSCRRALQAILDICHRAVVSPALAQEYDQHASPFGQRWRAAMTRRSKILETPATVTGRARGWMQHETFRREEREVVSKDVHLILAAWETGAVVLSWDNRARNLFSRIPDLARYGWAQMESPDIDDWLKGGANAKVVALGHSSRRAADRR